MFESFLLPNKVNMIIDGSFGSTGKGALACRIAMDAPIVHLACSTTSPNAGHTFYWNNKKHVTHLIPVAAIIHDRCGVYFSADSVIDYDLLMKEMDEFNIDDGRVFIHPRAAIITQKDKEVEMMHGGIEKIASTQSGSGAARAAKIMRTGLVAEHDPRLTEYVRKYDIRRDIQEIPDYRVMVETGQGLGLDLNHGLNYPHCTSRSVLPATILGELGLHPKYCGNVILSFRTFPIRVGNPTRDGIEVGNSGPFFDDSEEITFEDLGVEKEYTTVTKRVRRIATFSKRQYLEAIRLIEPTHVFMNFVNYVDSLIDLGLTHKDRLPDYIGLGPLPEQIHECPSPYAILAPLVSKEKTEQWIRFCVENIDDLYAMNSDSLMKRNHITSAGNTELRKCLEEHIRLKKSLEWWLNKK